MINWDRVDELRHEVGPEDFNEVIELFLEEVDDTISTLGMCDGNRTLEEQLHFLKGSALNIGFSDFASLCHADETASAQGQADQVDIAEIQAAYGAARAEFLMKTDIRYVA